MIEKIERFYLEIKSIKKFKNKICAIGYFTIKEAGKK